MNTCVFCQTANGNDKDIMIYRDDVVAVFPTHAPLQEGHLLVVPRQHVEDVFTMSKDDYDHLFDIARQLEPILKSLYQSPKVALIVSGLEVPHVHLHICPIYHHGDIDSGRAHVVPHEEMARVAEKIRQARQTA